MSKDTEVNKMALAKAIYAEIRGAEKPRKAFIERATAEIGLSTAGASSYHQMLKSAAAGKDMYRHHKPVKKEAVAPIAKPSNKGPKAKAAAVEVTASLPWTAEKAGKVKHFASRDKARAYNKDNGGGWKIAKV